jgi:hypothetical protein
MNILLGDFSTKLAGGGGDIFKQLVRELEENSDDNVVGAADCVTGSLSGSCKSLGETDCK